MTTIYNARMIEPTRSMGSPLTFIRHYARGTDADERKVPCNGCNACCRVKKLHVDLSDDELARYEHVWEPSIDGYALPKREDGSCIHLIDDKCSIYADRPHGCRVYDCRMAAVLGVNGNDDPGMAEVTGQWTMNLQSPADRDFVTAIRMAIAPGLACGESFSQLCLRAVHWRTYLPTATAMRREFESLPPAKQEAFARSLQAIMQRIADKQP